MKKVYYLLLLCLLPLYMMAQQVSVKGRVTDEKGAPVFGANVVLESDSKRLGGGYTNENGEYTVHANSAATKITVSFVGYKAETQLINGRTTIDLVLQVSNSSLNDVVVVGYGNQKKATVAGAVATLSGKELTVTKNENVVNMLTGKVAGVRTVQLSAEPGSFNTQYDIRGMGGTPLIIIDGIPRSSGDLSRMNPDEIESLSVLKDASAAIYGVKSANGVIVVTTKRGAKNDNGKFNLNYSINQSWQQFLNVPQGVDAVDFMLLTNERDYSGFNNFFALRSPTYSDANINEYLSGNKPSSDWMGAITRKSAPQTQHNVSLNGGTDKVRYYFGFGYLNQGSIFKTNAINYDKYNFRSNVDVTLTKRLRGGVNVSGYVDNKNTPQGRSVWEILKYAMNYQPTLPIYANNNPQYPGVTDENGNPVALIDNNLVGNSTYKNKNFQGQAYLEYDIPGIEGLYARGVYNYGMGMADNTTGKKTYNLYLYDAQNDLYIPSTVNSPSWVNRGYYTSTTTVMQLSLNYKRTFAKRHNVNAMVLYEENHQRGDNFQAQRNYSLGIPYLFAGDNADQRGTMDGNGLYETVMKSLIGRVGYDYLGRYILEVTMRNDGSSRFSPTARWGLFPAALAAWRISEEPFVQRIIDPRILSNLKVRGSYGLLGDDANVNYQWVAGYNYPGQGAILGGTYVNGINSQGVTNQNFTWLKSKTFNVGLDMDLWNGLLSGSVDYFVRNREGLPAAKSAQVPGTVGLPLPLENLNSDQNTSFEIVLGHRSQVAGVQYNISGNVSFTRFKNMYVEQTRQGNSYLNYKNNLNNRIANMWWGPLYGGQFSSYDQIYNYGINTGGGNQATLPGDYYYQDINQDGVIDDKDQVPIAIRDKPMVNFGMTLGASWKGFDLNVLLQGAANFHVEYDEQYAQPLTFGRSALVQFLDRWHPVDPKANVFDPKTTWVAGNYPVTGRPIAQGSKAVQNASYMRVKSLEIGYNLPHNVLKRVGIQNLRIYGNAYNLATITGLKYSDPEHPGKAGGSQNWDYGQAGYLYPQNRTYSVGASVSF
ncbi:TonB-linked outer membrane protein, SusC/RagA family [Chitinophaga jiangningensis]|uniref:TonB-linked outer membrane protein, SusC/RagA family n=1 Tax=Chitinophaga jiangningensis TaxID=1419482 RepID=A0A1M7J7N9_9BACT|nr:TonB-dependent receptor [Chitinophaga jiangningensis]SHM49004.1 TonB-linked outer membrane protein, SusC/RagA family [Chitinophaga jiangningensis]